MYSMYSMCSSRIDQLRRPGEHDNIALVPPSGLKDLAILPSSHLRPSSSPSRHPLSYLTSSFPYLSTLRVLSIPTPPHLTSPHRPSTRYLPLLYHPSALPFTATAQGPFPFPQPLVVLLLLTIQTQTPFLLPPPILSPPIACPPSTGLHFFSTRHAAPSKPLLSAATQPSPSSLRRPSTPPLPLHSPSASSQHSRSQTAYDLTAARCGWANSQTRRPSPSPYLLPCLSLQLSPTFPTIQRSSLRRKKRPSVIPDATRSKDE